MKDDANWTCKLREMSAQQNQSIIDIDGVKSNSPLFSVLIANYNNGQYLEECLQSVYKQTYTNWEIVIVDDGSTDEISQTIYQKIENHPKIRVFKNKENKGCGYTKAQCVDNAIGEFCGFLDPDDTLVPEAIELLMLEHLNFKSASLIYSTHFICDEHLSVKSIAQYVGQIPRGESQLTYQGPKISAFAIFKKENYLKTEGINTKLTKAVDQDLYYKIEETGDLKFVNKPLYFYRQHRNSISLGPQRYLAFKQEVQAKKSALSRRKNKELSKKVMTQIGNQFVDFAFEEKRMRRPENSLNAISQIIWFHKEQISFDLLLLIPKTLLDFLKFNYTKPSNELA